MIVATICLIILPSLFWIFLALTHKGKRENLTPNSISEVTAVLIIFNEEKHVYRKTVQMINELNDLKLSKKELIIISDGSTDNFEGELDKIELPDFTKVIKTPKRKGKPFSINLAKNLAKYEFIIFSDARQNIVSGSFWKILAPLNNVNVGAVSATLNNKNKFCLIRGILNFSKQLQSGSGNLIGVYGALFSIKKNLIPDIPEEIVLDDLYVSLHVLSQGNQVKISSKATVNDIEFKTLCAKKRVMRIVAGLQQILTDGNFRSQFSKSVLFYFCVAKIYRFVIPFILALMMANLDLSSLVFVLLSFSIILVIFPSIRYFLRSFTQVIRGLGSIKKHQTVFWNKTETIEH